MVIKEHESIIAELYYESHLIDIFYHYETITMAKAKLFEMIKAECECALQELKEVEE